MINSADNGHHFWSPAVRDLVPYTAGEQPRIQNLVKLNTNENPFPPSPHVKTAILAALGEEGSDLRLYPDPNATELKQTLANYHQVLPEEVFVGNSSDEVLAHIFMTFFRHPGAPLLTPDIGYSFYPVYCQLYDIPLKKIPLDKDFKIQPIDYSQTQQPACSGIILANPNAPTGILLSLQDIEQLLKFQPQRVVVIDEAYIDFGGQSAIALIKNYPNLLICQTFSKSRALAGLRVGYAIGQAHLIAGLERVKNSFNSYPLDRLALAGAVASLHDDAYFKQCCARIIENREMLVTHLEKLGFDTLPSSSNFVFTTHPRHDAQTLAAQLRAEGIIVRHFKVSRIDHFLRISIGTQEQQARLLEVLTRIVKS